MNKRAGAFGFDGLDQLLHLLDVVVSDNKGREGQLSRRTADVFDVGLVSLRVLMRDGATSDLQVDFRDVKRNAAEGCLVEHLLFFLSFSH